MSENNNPSYRYGSQYQYGGSQSTNSYQPISTNNYTNQQAQTNIVNKQPLLPYHEYMALQKQKALNEQNTSQAPTQQYPSNTQSNPQYQSSTQPYYYQSQYSSQYPQTYGYYPLQPYNIYVQQQQQQQKNASYHASSLVESQLQFQGQSVRNIQAQGLSISSVRDQPKPQLRQSPSPMKNAQFYNHHQPQYKNFSNPKHPTQKRSLSSKQLQSPHKPHHQQISPKKLSPNDISSSRHSRNYDHNYKNRINQQQDDYNMNLSSDGWSEEQEQQEMLYQKYQSKKGNYFGKTKHIQKKKDPVLDDPQQVKKWIQARKRNYPGLRKRLAKQSNLQGNNQHEQRALQKEKQRQEMSKLQYKIRKKLIIINGDSRSMMKKIRNIQILRRIVQDPKVLTRQRKNKYNNSANQQKGKLVQEIQKLPQMETDKIDVEEKEIIEVEEKLPEDGQFIEEKIIEDIQPEKLQTVKDKEDSSESQKSVQPQELPANKIPTDIVEPLQILEQQEQKQLQPPSQLFQFIQKPSCISSQKKTPQQSTKKQYKTLDPQTIIAHLKQKQKQDKESLNSLFDYKSNSQSYNYRVQTLQTSLKLDQIFAETTYLLQAIRYIVKEKFFDESKGSF